VLGSHYLELNSDKALVETDKAIAKEFELDGMWVEEEGLHGGKEGGREGKRERGREGRKKEGMKEGGEEGGRSSGE